MGSVMGEAPTSIEPGPLNHSELARVGLWVEFVRVGSFFYLFTSLVAVLGVFAGHEFVRLSNHPLAKRGDVISAFAAWDGEWYVRIVSEGYSYHPNRASSVAFFPAYPGLGWLVGRLTGLPPDRALLIVSHVCLAGAFVLTAAYVRRRFRHAPQQLTAYVLLATGFFPTTFFFRMAYSESLFLLVAVLALYGMEQKWPLLVIALVVGLATAARPVGLGLVAPLVSYLWHRSASLKGFVGRVALLIPLACWGIAAYALYQFLAFGEPLAFAHSQMQWRLRHPVPLDDKVFALETLEPVRSVFDPSSPGYWARHAPQDNPWLNLQLANPVFFLLTVTLIAAGAYRRWLSSYELAFASCTLFIPYVTRGYEMCMASTGRFAAVVFPVYLVLGHLLLRMPAPLAAALLAGSGLMLGAYAAMFASWHEFI